MKRRIGLRNALDHIGGKIIKGIANELGVEVGERANSRRDGDI